MAIIGKLREKAGWLLIAFVGVSMLAFILGEVLTNPGMFGTDDTVGAIAGEKISIRDFEKKVEEFRNNYMQNTQSSEVDQGMTDIFREQVWNQYINDLVLGKEYQALELKVSTEELVDMLYGKNIHPDVRKAFTDPQTGNFDPNVIINFLKELDKKEEAVQKRWIAFENEIKQRRIAEKYGMMIKKGLYVTSFEAKQDYIHKTRTATARYVLVGFHTVPDSGITVSESDLKKYYDEHKNEFKQEASRKIDYVTFEVTPSEEDRQMAAEWIAKKKAEFAAAEDDSIFIRLNAEPENSQFSGKYQKRGELPGEIDSIFFAAKTDTVVGPYLEEDVYKLYKRVDAKEAYDSVNARHILLNFTEGADSAAVRAQADSLKKVIKEKNKKNFEELAKQFSQDPGSADKGGDLGWFTEGKMVPSFNDACFNGKKGDLVVVESQFGIHIIDLVNVSGKSPVIKVGIVDRKIVPSEKTYQAVFAKANAFAGNNRTSEAYEKAIADQKLPKRVKEDLKETDKVIPGLESPRELVRWAFNAKKDEVSKVFEFGNKYVVARVVEVREKGIAPFEQKRTELETVVRMEKKAEKIMEKLKGDLQGVTKIEEVATKTGSSPQTIEHLAFAAASVPGLGMEPELIGSVFSLKQGVLSQPIKGRLGVFVVVADLFAEPAQQQDYKMYQNDIAQSMQGRADYELFDALKKIAEVEDNRARFY